MAIKRAIKRVVVGDQILLSEAYKQFILEKRSLEQIPRNNQILPWKPQKVL